LHVMLGVLLENFLISQ